MKGKLLLIMLIFQSTIYAQVVLPSVDTYIPDENISTSNNQTVINLIDIDYNNEKIPLNLVYYPNGVKINERSNSVGLKWEIENIGYIHHKINDKSDYLYKGWFTSLDPTFNDLNTCYLTNPTTYIPNYNPATLNENDYSPDFFLLKISNGINFDYLFKKNVINGSVFGNPIVEFLSNPDDCKVNTIFSNIIASSDVVNYNTVFNVKDKKGSNYNFINGPNTGTNNIVNNNFYLKNINNPNNSDFVNIEYFLNNKDVIYQYFSTGFTPPNHTNDWNNNYVHNNRSNERYEINESRLDLKKITTRNAIIYFEYLPNKFLNEINVTDIYNNYVYGYKFEYFDVEGDIKQLTKIKKYNNTKNISQIIYEFEYFPFDSYHFNDGNNPAFGSDLQSPKDYLGYYNGNFNRFSQFPMKIVTYPNGNIPNPYGILVNETDLEPNLQFAKNGSLHVIKNKFSGLTEFDYQLNMGNNSLSYNLYGGGVVISSIKKSPIIGKQKITTYSYDKLLGFNFGNQLISNHYIRPVGLNFKYYTSIPILSDGYDELDSYNLLYNVHENGNFFGQVTESNYDYQSMNLESKIIKNYVSNSEGSFRRPMLKSEIFKNAMNQDVKKNEYFYNIQNLSFINAVKFYVESRKDIDFWDMNLVYLNSSVLQSIRYCVSKMNMPIYINRVNLSSFKETLYNSNGEISNNILFTYLNNNSKSLKSKTNVSPTGETIKENYFYPTDFPFYTEQFSTELISQNIVGVPIKIDRYESSEKVSETKNTFTNDVTTSNLLLPKFVYTKKGLDTNSILEKNITYDKYDIYGNLLQYTLESGVPVSIIWGYNNTKPIAKIENLDYSSILPSSLIAIAQTESNINNNEANVIIALNNIRSNISLANAFITTITYKSLIGISTITDEKGYKLTFTYDTFNRLSCVKDINGNIISENKYNFIPQN